MALYFKMTCKNNHEYYFVDSALMMSWLYDFQETEKAKKGMLGPDIQDYLLLHPNAMIKSGSRLFVCRKCGLASVNTCHTIVRLKERVKQNLGNSCEMSEEERAAWDFFRKWKPDKVVRPGSHICKECGGTMYQYNPMKRRLRRPKMRCPDCGENIKIECVGIAD